MIMQLPGRPGGHSNPEQGIGHRDGVAVEEPNKQPDRFKGQLRAAIPPDESQIIIGSITDDLGAQLLILDLIDPNLLHPRLGQKRRHGTGPPLRLVLLALPRRGGEAGLIDPDRFSPAPVVSLRNESAPECGAEIILDCYRIGAPGLGVGVEREHVEGRTAVLTRVLQPVEIGPDHAAQKDLSIGIGSTNGVRAIPKDAGILLGAALPPERRVLLVIDLVRHYAPVLPEPGGDRTGKANPILLAPRRVVPGMVILATPSRPG